MNVRQMPLEELELLSYTDIAYEVLKLDKKSKTTPTLFSEVCKLLELDIDAMMDVIGDFYTNLTTDKRFILLDNAEWDLKELHSIKIVVDDDEEETDEEADQEDIEGTEDDAVTSDTADFDDVDEMDDLEDLAIVSEEELEEE